MCIRHRPAREIQIPWLWLEDFSHREQHTLKLHDPGTLGTNPGYFFCLVGGLSPWKPEEDILYIQTLVRIWSLTGEDHLLPELALLR